jgi:hypothetical protein
MRFLCSLMETTTPLKNSVTSLRFHMEGAKGYESNFSVGRDYHRTHFRLC